ncbi:hypothetical protein DFJ74DRAFT_291601 [Hyaloraphidium curvatum]|nr:hypothetical protein DFJ74DRAFT_291601 [Hyaloraphidium curvatum]
MPRPGLHFKGHFGPAPPPDPRIKDDREAGIPPVAAIEYAGAQADLHKVKKLLARIGDPKALAGWAAPTNWRVCRGVTPLLAKLVAHGLDTPENLRLLFGPHLKSITAELDEARVYKDPPEGSPAYEMMAPNIGMTQKQLNKEQGRDCDGCGTKQKESGEEFHRCSACKRAVYCSKACQRADWAKHKPECLQARGKEVSEEAKEAAEAARQAEEARKKREYEAWMFAEFATFLPGTPSHDCDGRPRRRDLPWFGEDLLVGFGDKYGIEGEKLSFVFMPPGIPQISGRNRCVAYRCDKTEKDLVVFITRLFADNGDGTHNGTAIDEVFERTERSDDLFQGREFVEVKLPAAPGVPKLDRIMGLLEGMTR